MAFTDLLPDRSLTRAEFEPRFVGLERLAES
jgi:hypothetical protein